MSTSKKLSEQTTERWFRQTVDKIEADYARLHEAAKIDAQYAGHGGESGWKGLLEKWLPPHYEIGTRKYIITDQPRVDDTESKFFETDLVIFNPSYPKVLREESEVLAGGVLAAFSVKLTLDAAGIDDAARRASILKRSTTVRINTPRHHLQGPFSVGLLAHSHNWKAEKSTPFENVERNLKSCNRKYAKVPREVMDFTCVADLAEWSTSHWVGLPSSVQVSTGSSGVESNTHPVARFIMQLIYRLSFVDPTLRHWAHGLLASLPVGSKSNVDWRRWQIGDALPERVIAEIHRRGFDNIGGSPSDWSCAFA